LTCNAAVLLPMAQGIHASFDSQYDIAVRLPEDLIVARLDDLVRGRVPPLQRQNR